MANNRMYLVHRPSGIGVYLGKRMCDGYYGVPDDLADGVQLMFDRAEEHFLDGGGYYLDDVVVATEGAVEGELVMPGHPTFEVRDVEKIHESPNLFRFVTVEACTPSATPKPNTDYATPQEASPD